MQPSIRSGLPGHFSISSSGQRFQTTAGAPNLTHGSHWRWKGRHFLNFPAPNFSRVWSPYEEELFIGYAFYCQNKWRRGTQIQKHINIITYDFACSPQSMKRKSSHRDFKWKWNFESCRLHTDNVTAFTQLNCSEHTRWAKWLLATARLRKQWLSCSHHLLTWHLNALPYRQLNHM